MYLHKIGQNMSVFHQHVTETLMTGDMFLKLEVP